MSFYTSNLSIPPAREKKTEKSNPKKTNKQTKIIIIISKAAIQSNNWIIFPSHEPEERR